MSKFAEKVWREAYGAYRGKEVPFIIYPLDEPAIAIVDAALKKQRKACARAFGANFYLEDSPLWNLHGDKIREAILNAEVADD